MKNLRSMGATAGLIPDSPSLKHPAGILPSNNDIGGGPRKRKKWSRAVFR